MLGGGGPKATASQADHQPRRTRQPAQHSQPRYARQSPQDRANELDGETLHVQHGVSCRAIGVANAQSQHPLSRTCPGHTLDEWVANPEQRRGGQQSLHTMHHASLDEHLLHGGIQGEQLFGSWQILDHTGPAPALPSEQHHGHRAQEIVQHRGGKSWPCPYSLGRFNSMEGSNMSARYRLESCALFLCTHRKIAKRYACTGISCTLDAMDAQETIDFQLRWGWSKLASSTPASPNRTASA